MKKITRFVGEYDFLSNFYPCDIVLDGTTYPSVEHAYQASKTTNIKTRQIICNAKTPGRAKYLGSRVILRKNWDKIKLNVMENLVLQKFNDNKELRVKLLHTGDTQIEEGNYWGDTFWGVYKGKGKNHLGKILMKTRSSIK